jgi:hypothetical protein
MLFYIVTNYPIHMFQSFTDHHQGFFKKLHLLYIHKFRHYRLVRLLLVLLSYNNPLKLDMFKIHESWFHSTVYKTFNRQEHISRQHTKPSSSTQMWPSNPNTMILRIIQLVKCVNSAIVMLYNIIYTTTTNFLTFYDFIQCFILYNFKHIQF